MRPLTVVPLVLVAALVALLAAGHALLYKRDSRAALGWISVCFLFPLIGPLLYYVFGINRVRTRAQKNRPAEPLAPVDEDTASGAVPGEFAVLARISNAVSRWPLVGPNRVEMLHNGEEVYPAMLDAIESAQRSLYLATYIFETNTTGQRFSNALGQAVDRGVDVRVLIDGIGDLYARPRTSEMLADRGVPVARFIPPRLIPPAIHINLRNHRKILVADSRVAFVGGMNIGDRHLAANTGDAHRVVDAHFRLSGPVVGQIEQTFLEDWAFATGGPEDEAPRSGPAPDEPAAAAGGALCRTLVDGPNEDLDRLLSVLQGAISTSRRSVEIMTPYFLPPRDLVGALQAAALRGVEVSIVLPARNNLPVVHWASRNMLWELLERGVRIYYQPPPFAHTKLFVVDRHYAMIGSANIDPRSLRLNFELAVEVYDRDFASVVSDHFRAVRERSREVSRAELDARRLPVRLRDATAWLFTPYL